MAAASTRVFSLEGKGLKLDTAEDLEAHIANLRAMDDVEEVRLLGNTLGIGACKLLGEVLATKKSLQVRGAPPPPPRHHHHHPLIPDGGLTARASPLNRSRTSPISSRADS